MSERVTAEEIVTALAEAVDVKRTYKRHVDVLENKVKHQLAEADALIVRLYKLLDKPMSLPKEAGVQLDMYMATYHIDLVRPHKNNEEW